MSMYTGAKAVPLRFMKNSNGFEVKFGMHQGSALSPLLFVTVMEALLAMSPQWLYCGVWYCCCGHRHLQPLSGENQ